MNHPNADNPSPALLIDARDAAQALAISPRKLWSGGASPFRIHHMFIGGRSESG